LVHLDEFDAAFVDATQERVIHPAVPAFVRDLECLGAIPLNVDDGNEPVGSDATERSNRYKFLELANRASLSAPGEHTPSHGPSY